MSKRIVLVLRSLLLHIALPWAGVSLALVLPMMMMSTGVGAFFVIVGLWLFAWFWFLFAVAMRSDPADGRNGATSTAGVRS